MTSRFRQILSSVSNSLVKSFWRLSTADWYILPSTDRRAKFGFVLTGILVLLVLALSLFAFFLYGADLLLGRIGTAIFTLVCTFIFTWIYLLLLLTLDPSTLPHRKENVSTTFSDLIRVFGIIFLGVIVSFPLVEWFNKHEAQSWESLRKQELVANIDSLLFQDKELELNALKLNLTQVEAINNFGDYDNEILELSTEIHDLEKSYEVSKLKTEEYINSKSLFFIRLKLLYKNKPVLWLESFLFVLIFLFPLLIKIYILKKSSYYKHKGQIDKEWIKQDYMLFLQRYRNIFQDQFGKEVEFYEPYHDAPFNTKPKRIKPNLIQQSGLLKRIYEDE